MQSKAQLVRFENDALCCVMSGHTTSLPKNLNPGFSFSTSASASGIQCMLFKIQGGREVFKLSHAAPCEADAAAWGQPHGPPARQRGPMRVQT